ncbi:hypothetical protein FQR65_LT09708 [Abscondita terminalis]|nr:hypothetical protein FQR65_LT09708 [Abscondita terminalis]
MFFAIEWLLPQHGGKFAIAWLCATRGVRYRRKQILECDLLKLCADMYEMIVTESRRPRLRFSLSLSSRLINGTVKIYREQVNALEVLVLKLMLLKPHQFQLGLDNSSEPMPISKVSKKRKKRQIASVEDSLVVNPEIVNENLQEIIVELQRKVADEQIQTEEGSVTMREAVPQFNPLLDNLRDEGGFGVLQDINPPTFPDFASTDITVLQLVPTVSLIHFYLNLIPFNYYLDMQVEQQPNIPKTPTKRKATRTRSEVRSKKSAGLDLEQIVELEAIPPQIDVQPIIPDEEIIPVQPEPQPPVLIEEPIPKIPATRVKKTKKPDLTKALVHIKVLRSVNIDRTSVDEYEEFDLWKYKNVRPMTNHKPNFEQFITKLIQDDTNMERFFDGMETSSRFQSRLFKSLGVSDIEVRGGPIINQTTRVPSLTKSHEIVVAVDVHPEPSKKRRTAEPIQQLDTLNINEVNIEQRRTEEPIQHMDTLNINEINIQPVPVSLNVPGFDHSNLITAVPFDKTVINELPPAATSSEVPVNGNLLYRKLGDIQDVRTRLKIIKQIVKRWDSKKQGPMTIEDVCIKPINRFHIAITFNDLLVLHKIQYVKLCSKENSLELNVIEKGAKFKE